MHLTDSQLLKARRDGAAEQRPDSTGSPAARSNASSARNNASSKAKETATGPICLLTTCHPERALSRALIQHLGEEMKDITFLLRAADGVSAVWICGYEPGAEHLISLVRSRYPKALLLVTGRGNPDDWRDEVLAAGADHADSWPIPYEHLSQLLHGRRKAV